MLPASKIDSFIFFLLSVKFLLSDLFLSLPLAAFFFCRNYQLSLSYRHYLTFTSPCRYPRHSPLSVITRLDRVISLPSPPILRMPRSGRSMTGWNGNLCPARPFRSDRTGYPVFVPAAGGIGDVGITGSTFAGREIFPRALFKRAFDTGRTAGQITVIAASLTAFVIFDAVLTKVARIGPVSYTHLRAHETGA